MEGTVESVVSAGVVVRLSNGIEGFLPRREIACDKNADIMKLFKAGDAIKVLAKEMRKEERRMILSQREIERREERESMKQYMKEPAEDEGSAIGSMYKNLFDDLKKKMGQ
jgi:ribosomal protein S1